MHGGTTLGASEPWLKSETTIAATVFAFKLSDVTSQQLPTIMTHNLQLYFFISLLTMSCALLLSPLSRRSAVWFAQRMESSTALRNAGMPRSKRRPVGWFIVESTRA